jgi:hypothetical protein
VTKSKLVGRGGARSGAGRKPKPVAGPTHIAGAHRSDEEPGATANTSTPIIPPNLSPEEKRQYLKGVAEETLATIMVTGTSESARVAAAREALDRAEGKPKPGTAAKSDQLDLLDDGWGGLLTPSQPAARRAN